MSEDSRAVAKAQIPAGFALYKDVFPNAFNADGSASSSVGYDTETAGNLAPFVGNGKVQFAVLLGEGIGNWIASFGDTSGWQEFDPARILDMGDGSYLVVDLRLAVAGAVNASVMSTSPIPLAAWVFR